MVFRGTAKVENNKRANGNWWPTLPSTPACQAGPHTARTLTLLA